MANLDDAVNALLPVMNDLQPRMRSWLATAGDGRGNVIDTSVPNHVFVRVLNNAIGTAPAVQTISVFNDLAMLADGDRCVIGFGPERPRLLRVLARQDQRYDTATDGTFVGGTNQGVLPHAWQHAWLAPDPVFIDFFQVINLAVYPAGGLSVAIQRGLIPRIGIDTLVDHQILDLTSYVPVSGALWALLSVSPAGAIVVTLSSTVGSRVNLDYTLIPDTPAGNFRLAAVALYAGQTDIILTPAQQDIFDLRWPQENSPDALGFGTAQYQYIVTGATPFAPMWSTGFLNITATKTLTINNSLALSGTDGGAISLAVTNGKTLTLTATDNYNLTIPKTGTATVGTGMIGRIAEWVADANTLQASSLIKTGVGTLTIDAGSTQTIAFGGSNGGTITFGAASKTLTINDSIVLAGGGNTLTINTSLTWPADAAGVLTNNGAGVLTWGPSGGTHTILSATHTDTLADSVVRGDLIVGNLTPKWARLALGGSAKSFVTRDANDVLWSTGLLDVATGKTLTVNNSLMLSGTDGKSITLTGSLTVPVDGTAALGAGTLTVSTANDVTGATHTHAITSSSGPGAAASLLATDAGGALTLKVLNLTDGSDIVLNYSNGGLYSYSTLLWLAASTPRVITLPDLDGTVALGAGTLTVSSTNSVTVASHTHAITSSSAPGAAASILATDASGNLTIGGAFGVSAGTARIREYNVTNLANNGTASLLGVTGFGNNTYGFVFVYDSDGFTAIYLIDGGNQTTYEISDVFTVYTPTAGTASSTNIYWSAANSRYELENKRGATKSYRILQFMYA